MQETGKKDTVKKSDFEFLSELYYRLKKLYKLIFSNDKNVKDMKIVEEIQILHDQMITKIDSIIKSNDTSYLRLLAMKIILLYKLSKLLISLNKECQAEEILCKVFEDIKPVFFKAEIIYLGLRIVNHYAYLIFKRGNYIKSREILEFAIWKFTAHENLTMQNSEKLFYNSDDLYSPKDKLSVAKNDDAKLEHLITNNLQMLVFTYNKLELHEKYAIYYHKILKRQLLLHHEDITIWALKAARLASHFLENDKYKIARHHLAAAIHVLYLYEKELKTLPLSDDTMAKWQNLQLTFANISNCWVKYGLFLFNMSKNNTMLNACHHIIDNSQNIGISTKQEDNNFTSNTHKTCSKEEIKPFCVQNSYSNPVVDKDDDNLYFESLDVTEYEKQITASLIESTEEARSLYLHTISWIKKAQVFFTLNDHPMEYINSTLDLSELYRHLLYFEDNLESQYNIQKLRAEAIETLCSILKEVRPQCYLMVSIELYKELAEVQLEMMCLNLKRICVTQENTSDSCELAIHKTEALADVYSKLEQFSDNLGHNVNSIDSHQLLSAIDVTDDISQYVNM